VCTVADLDNQNSQNYLCIDSKLTFNAIFGKVGMIASDEVVLELFKKCLPVLLYGTEACLVKKSHTASVRHRSSR